MAIVFIILSILILLTIILWFSESSYDEEDKDVPDYSEYFKQKNYKKVELFVFSGKQGIPENINEKLSLGYILLHIQDFKVFESYPKVFVIMQEP